MSLASADARARAETVLAQVRALQKKCLAHSKTWTATPDDALVLNEATLLTGRSLPPDVFTAPSVALAFLQIAKVALEGLVAETTDGARLHSALEVEKSHDGAGSPRPASLRAILGDYWVPLTVVVSIALILGLVWWWTSSPIPPCCKTFWPAQQ
jgi:hypothetical protein